MTLFLLMKAKLTFSAVMEEWEYGRNAKKSYILLYYIFKAFAVNLQSTVKHGGGCAMEMYFQLWSR